MACVNRFRLWELLEPSRPGDSVGRVVDLSISSLIALSVVATVFQSVQAYDEAWGRWFRAFEVFCLVVFSLEYVLRVAACGVDARYRGARGLVRYVVSPMAVIDLAAILPGLLSVGVDLRVLRSFRLLRLFRLGRYSRGMRLLGVAFQRSSRQLWVCASGVLLFLLVSSSAMYYVENEHQPEAFASIPASMWWGVCTLTTVGYGDIYPETALGRFMAGIIALLGIGAFAMPAGIIAANFQAALADDGARCPHCGEAL